MSFTPPNWNERIDPRMTTATIEKATSVVAAKASATKVVKGQISIDEMVLGRMRIRIVGTSPLIVHKWDEKVKKEMLDAQMGIPKAAGTPKHAKKDPEADYRASLYIRADKSYGFPAIGLKAAAVRACTFMSDMKMTEARGMFHIIPDLVMVDGALLKDDLVKIDGEPHMRQDMVRVGMGSADIRHRAEFKEWSSTFDVEFMAGLFQPETLINMFNIAGFAVGIGEWRPQKNGQNGRF